MHVHVYKRSLIALSMHQIQSYLIASTCSVNQDPSGLLTESVYAFLNRKGGHQTVVDAEKGHSFTGLKVQVLQGTHTL